MEERKKYSMNAEDRERVTHKYYNPDLPHDGLRRFAYLGYDCDPATGLSDEELRAGIAALAKSQDKNMPHSLAKAEALAYAFANTRIDVNDNDWYVGFYSWGRVTFTDYPERWRDEMFNNQLPEIRDLMQQMSDAGLCDSWLDYDHAVPDWDAIMTLGFPGMLKRAESYRKAKEKEGALDEKTAAYYLSIEKTLSAIVTLLNRFLAYAKTKSGKKIPKIITCLEHLCKGEVTDTYEALQLMYLYFILSESFDCYQVRSLGNGFDRIVEPYYRRDLESGHATKEELDDYIAYFLMQFYAIGNGMGQPLFLGGTNADGTTKYTPFAKRVLELWDDLDIYNPKIQVLFGESTPKDVRYLVYDMLRRGKYMTIVCEDGARRAVKVGYDCTDDEARDFIVSGCYEPLVRGGTLIENGYPNLVKPVSLAMRDGFDPKTGRQIGPHTGLDFPDFDSFFGAFEIQLADMFAKMRRITNTSEAYLSEVNPAILLSATKVESLRRGEDGYSMKDPKATTLFELNAYGTCVDALAAIKHLVFDTRKITLAEFVKALDANWEGYSELRRAALTECAKYGNNNPEADEIAKRVSLLFPKYIFAYRNLRGAKFLCEYHGAMEYAWQGTRTEATADGRFAGSELSKNASPTVGADVNGATAFLLSATAAVCPETAPAGFNTDVMLHPTALTGEQGLIALDALISVYRKRGGIDVQFNVVLPETLRDAQKHPEKYRNLQIRVTGWNVLWNDIPADLQESYIRRSETVTGN